jgi:hypothetical protein
MLDIQDQIKFLRAWKLEGVEGLAYICSVLTLLANYWWILPLNSQLTSRSSSAGEVTLRPSPPWEGRVLHPHGTSQAEAEDLAPQVHAHIGLKGQWDFWPLILSTFISPWTLKNQTWFAPSKISNGRTPRWHNFFPLTKDDLILFP